MDNKNKVLLQRFKNDIIRDLDVAFIIDNLYSRNAISHSDNDYILKNVRKNREGTARYLVDKLIQSGSNSTFQAFVDSLTKDYYWLAEKFTMDTNNVTLNESLEDNLRKGDVPRLPEHHIRRIHLENVVENKLNNLSRHNFLVLHGPTGSGKTALAITVLRHNPDMVNTTFNSSVFWLRVDGCMTEDDIIAQQTKLYRKASACYTNSSYMNSTVSMSSIGSNGDNTSLSCYDWTVNELTDRLKALFSQQDLLDALLVLDKVNDRKIVEAFDIGCKILVTTKDVDVVSEFHPEIMKIDDKFEEKESLEVLASFLDTEISQLPRQAKKLHELLKGNPYYIAFIGAQLAENKEKLMHQPKHWNYFVRYIEKKEFFFLPSNKSNPMKTVEMCINSLESEALSLFEMLAVLPDNVRVSAKMLCRFWNKEVHEVDSIMKMLLRKALVYATYDKDQHNYIYEIHSLIMNYLRSVTNKEEMKRLHTLIVKNYNYDGHDVPVEIVDDGYIAFYIGYHISHTNMLSLFNKLYLDPRFLGNKARLTGPADVIIDLNKYETHIIAHELDRELLNNIKAYLSTHGVDLYRYPNTDIIQNILQNESKGILYAKAIEIAQERVSKNELYFEFLHEQNVEEIKPSNIDVKEVVWSVCFLGDYVLIGTNTGIIKVFHISANKLKKELQGSGSPIKWISACPLNPPMVATLDNNGYIKLWYLDELVREPSEDTIEEEPEEAFYKYTSNTTISPPLEPFINCRWAQYEEILVAHTSNVVTLYKPSGVIVDVFDSFDKNCNVVNCVPFCDESEKYLIVALENTCYTIEVICRRRKRTLMCFEVTDSIINILTVPGSNTVIIHTEKEIVKNVIELKANSYNCNVCKTKTVISGNDVKDNLKFISVAVNNSGTLLFVSTDDSRVICIDLNTNAHLFDLENRRGNVVSMSVSEVWYDFMPGSDVLLTGTGTVENCAKIWYLDSAFVAQATQKNSKARLTTIFDVSFLNSISPQTPGSATPNNGVDCVTNSPRRHQSFLNYKEMEKKVVKKTASLDRHTLKPLNLKGICNGNFIDTVQPLLAVVDDKNHIQILRGRKFLTEITEKSGEQITTVKISPCNQYIIYGLNCGSVKKYSLRTKETKAIMEVYSPVEYMKFVSADMLIVAGKSCRLMAYCFSDESGWEPQMLERGNANLGSQEILNDIQGVKKKNGQPERLPSSGSDSSISSKDRMFPGTESKELCQRSGLLYAHWLPDLGLVTVERNATIKLWDHSNTAIVLQGRKTKARVTCAVIRKHTLVVCDGNYKRFQTFELKAGNKIELRTIQEYQLNNKIVSCDLTADGFLLAMGLDSGDVVLWNVVGRRQLRLLKHHNSKVQWCSFSPVPNPSLYTGGAISTDDEPPLVLVTMAAEIVWWNITYLMRSRTNKNVVRSGMNVVSPLLSPVETRPETSPLIGEETKLDTNYFFAGFAQDCWKTIWRGKTYKEGSKKKEILACIKLSGVSAKKLCHDNKLSCFVTVDNPGHIHIMNVMRNDT